MTDAGLVRTMQTSHVGEVTLLLAAFRNGEPAAEARLMELTYVELRKIAAAHMRRERAAISIQTSDLVHETYLRLVNQATAPLQDRTQFFQFAARVMRQILVDRARKRRAGKRGGDVLQISLDKALDLAETNSGDILALEQALARLQRVDPRQCQVVEMKFFAGMPIQDIAKVLNITQRTVNRDWCMARAWLYKEMHG